MKDLPPLSSPSSPPSTSSSSCSHHSEKDDEDEGFHDMLQCLVCPITHDLMVEPAIASDGFTYERKAIISWLSRHDRSPVTNEKLSSRLLIPNYAIKQAVQEYCQRTGTTLPAIPPATTHATDVPEKALGECSILMMLKTMQ